MHKRLGSCKAYDPTLQRKTIAAFSLLTLLKRTKAAKFATIPDNVEICKRMSTIPVEYANRPALLGPSVRAVHISVAMSEGEKYVPASIIVF